jgi:hypothetical protein
LKKEAAQLAHNGNFDTYSIKSNISKSKTLGPLKAFYHNNNALAGIKNSFEQNATDSRQEGQALNNKA